jgi:hypothetical protein
VSTTTNKVIEGASFPEFVMESARAFSPLISLRDTPDAPIPERIEASTGINEDMLREAKARKAEIEAMSTLEAETAAEAEVAVYKQRMSEMRRELADAATKLREMRAQVEQWSPPSESHVALKQHMLDSLDREIEWQSRHVDNNELERIGGEEWRRRMIAKLDAEIARTENVIEEKRASAEFATKWLMELRASLGLPA